MGSWFCIYDDLANPKIGLNLVSNGLYRKNVGQQQLEAEKNNNICFLKRKLISLQKIKITEKWIINLKLNFLNRF
jgi:hypothetical protein